MRTLSRLVFYPALLFVWLMCPLGVVAQNLPAEVASLLNRARIPQEAISLYVVEASPSSTAPLVSHRATTLMHPASVMKLVTSVAALDLLGPAYTWQTQVLADFAGKEGRIQDGVLEGDLIIKGGGDPKLVVERLWQLLARVRSLGIDTINGDIVLDHSAFELPPASAASAALFDGEPSKPYNASPDALLINFKSIVMTFTPSLASETATVHYEPPLFGVTMPSTVPLSLNTDCSDYRTSLAADFSDSKRIRFLGSYPKSCGERTWSTAYADPAAFAGLAVRGLWHSMGGKLAGTLRTGMTRPQAKPLLTYHSVSLSEALRDMNKFSNNVMAQQIFLSLSLNANGRKPASFEASRQMLRNWWQSCVGLNEAAPLLIIDNGSGLSRLERVTTLGLARMLQKAFVASYMPELMTSLAQAGVDGTLRRSKVAAGAAHLKTGSLNNVIARAGYVHGNNGKRYVLVAIVNADTGAIPVGTSAALDALIDWTARQ